MCCLLFLQIRLCCASCMVLLLFLSNSLNVQNGFASLDAVLKSYLKDLVFYCKQYMRGFQQGKMEQL